MIVIKNPGWFSGNKVYLLDSDSCTKQTCGNEATMNARRQFKRVTTGTEPFDSIKGITSSAFFDLDEDVNLR
jgi:hypothetical protein